jgi:plastocyanin
VRGSAPRRVLLLLTAAAVAAALILGPTAALAAPAETPGCTWQRHSKTLIKHLRRHGQPRRVKRVKHWWTCEAQPSLLQPQPALPTTPAPATPPSEEPEPEVGHVGVKAVEYSYTLSRPEVSAGEVIVELNNQGEDPHNLVLEHEGTADPDLEIPSTPSVTQASAEFTLAPGSYRLYCSLYKHEAKGMEATLVVAGG